MHHFTESGFYVYNVYEMEDGNIKFVNKLVNDPPYCNLSFIILLCVFIGLVILWPLLLYMYRCFKSWRGSDTDYFLEMDEWETKIEYLSERSITSNTRRIGLKLDDVVEVTKKPKRLLSLDVFRGLAVVLMIFINSGGGGFYFMGYSVWNGLLVADFIFPSFLFIMGYAIHLSHENMVNQHKRKRDIFFRIFVRSVNLIIVGLLLNKGTNLLNWRVPGVLQKLGICYFLIAMLNFLASPSEISIKKWDYYKYLSPFKDILPFWIQWLIVTGFIVAHVTISLYLPVPGCPTGYLGPGGLAENGKYFNCNGGAAGYIDRLLFHDKHLYQFPIHKEIYKTKQVFDAEGLLGYLSSFVLTFFGVQAGRIVSSYQSHSSYIVRWFLWAILTGSIGFGLTLNSQDEGIIPINGKLWSISYVFVTVASSFMLMILFHALCDCFKIWLGAPFKFCGVNSLALYIGHQLLPLNFYWREGAIPDHASYVVVSAIPTALWILFSIILYKKKTFFTF